MIAGGIENLPITRPSNPNLTFGRALRNTFWGEDQPRYIYVQKEDEANALRSQVKTLEGKFEEMNQCFTIEGTSEQKLQCLENVLKKPKTAEPPKEIREAVWDKAIRMGPLRFENEARARKRAEELTKLLNYPFEVRARWIKVGPELIERWDLYPAQQR